MHRYFELIYENNDFLVCNKAANVLSIPDRFDKEKSNLLDVLKRKREELFVVHRLDKGTSGLICFAKNSESHKHLSQLFEQRKIRKLYSCIVEGNLESPEGTIDNYLIPDKNRGGKMKVSKVGKRAISNYNVIQQFREYAYLHVLIETGRTHQIRVHCSDIGHPIVGDSMYGGKPAFYLSSIKGKKYRKGKMKEERPLLFRIALHAKELKFQDIHANEHEFSCDEPKDMKAVLNQLRKHSSFIR